MDDNIEKRRRVFEMAAAEGVPYGMRLPDRLFEACGYSADDLDELDTDLYHLQEKSDDTVLPVAVVLDALLGTVDGRYSDIDHLANVRMLYEFDWCRELDRVLFNLYIDRGLQIDRRMIAKFSRQEWATADENPEYDPEELPWKFTGSLDEAVRLFAPNTLPDRIPWEPIAVCFEALSRWPAR